ncbi:MAG: hypothetical protein ACI9UK_002282, partial [Candidatus Krumholzibacteriia bacterium]
MRWTVAKTKAAETAGDLLVVPVFQKKDAADLAHFAKLLPGGADLKTVAKSGGFKGSEGSLLACHRADVKAGWVLMVGMGKSN